MPKPTQASSAPSPAFDPQAIYRFRVRRRIEDSPLGRLLPMDEHEASGAILNALAEEDLTDVVRLSDAE
jgi:hypothetical protein